MVHLKMYIVNGAARSQEKVETFRRLLEGAFGQDFHLDVLDIMENLEAAREDNVLATPTVIKSHPGPRRRIVGDLSDGRKIFEGLDIGAYHPAFKMQER